MKNSAKFLDDTNNGPFKLFFDWFSVLLQNTNTGYLDLYNKAEQAFNPFASNLK